MSLTGSYTFVGHGNWSLDAVGGSATGGGTLTVHVPTGSHVEKAFLYATTYDGAPSNAYVHMTSGAFTYDVNAFINLGYANSYLQAYRADVTGFISTIVGGGSSTDFSVNLNSILGGGVDGYVLAVVYSNSSESTRTIALLDGASATTGDSFNVNFSQPIDTTLPGFSAQMSLGIGFGYQQGMTGQQSQVTVNGQRLTTSAGGSDDGAPTNGGLVTVGGIGDSADNPVDPYASASDPRDDDELYNLANGGFLHNGDTSIHVETLNPSNDDNIFFAGFNITAEATVDSDGNDAPIAVANGGTGFTTFEAMPFTTASVLANDQDPDGDPLNIISFDTTGTHGSVTLNANGTFNYNPGAYYNYLNTGEQAFDVFTYTISDGDKTATAQVIITVKGQGNTTPPPSTSGFIRLSNGNDTVDYGTSANSVLVQGLGGNDRITGSRYNDSLNGGTGNDLLGGGAGKDVLTGGKGTDRMSGGAGNDTFMFNASDLGSTVGTADHIIDFHGAGGYMNNPAIEEDFIGFQGFGAGTTLSYHHSSTTNPLLQYYQIIDPTNSANNGYIIVQMATSTTHLAAGDYAFFG